MTSHNAREPVDAIPGEIAKTARDLVGDYLDISDRRGAQLAKLVAKAIHEAVMAERERDQWRPIETAPKDWTDILLYLPDEDDGTGSRGVVKGWFSMADGGSDCWMSYEANSGQCYPTRWMPLPAAPKTEG